MKRKIFGSLLMLLVLFPIGATEDNTLQFQSCSLREGQLFVSPLKYVVFYFDGVYERVTLPSDSFAKIYCGEEVVATGRSMVEYYTLSSGKTYPCMQIEFDSIILPKGNNYRFHLPAKTVVLERDESIGNEEYNIAFKVPEYLLPRKHSIENGATLIWEDGMSFYFWVETKDNSDVKTVLYREKIPVRVLDAYSFWEWDLGQVHVIWDKRMYFEKGVNYSLVLPEGAVHSMYRDDLVNKEERMNFVGGYEQPFPELKQAWCSLNESEAVEALNEVQWGYTQQVALSLAPQIELRTDANELLKAVVPTLAEVEGEWVMTADFENYAIDPNQVYHLVIPESTVVTPDGDVVVNKETILRIANGVVGISDINSPILSITCINNQLHIEGTTPGDPVTLYTIEGKVITTQVAQGTSVVMELPHKGLFIVVVNGKAHKVVNG